MNTYTQIHIHVVFAVQNRQSLIASNWQERLYQYMTSIIQNNGHKVLSIGGMPDHVHLLVGLRPTESLSHLIQEVKRDSSLWINNNHLSIGKFSWQEGFGAFSYSKSQIHIVSNYIEKQAEHHQKESFIEEYKNFLKMFGIDFDERFVFKQIE